MKPRKDITGQVFGRLTAINYHDAVPKKNGSFWKCKCECGKETFVRRCHLIGGKIVSCGCYRLEQVTKALFNDLTGQRFGRLTAISAFKTPRGYWWKCKCDCGNSCEVKSTKLVSCTRSCGCLMREIASRNFLKITKRQKGPKHPRWNPDISAEERANRIKNKGQEYRLSKWRNKVYTRDNFTCKKCGDKRGGNLNSHHIYSQDIRQDLKYTVSNGITLCETCHKKFHHSYGYGKNTKKQLTEYMKL